MNLKHPVIDRAELACIACPELWEGDLIDGSTFRLRYRNGWASLTVSTPVDVYPYRTERTDGEQVGDGLAGIFEDDAQRNAVFARLYARVVTHR